MSTLRRHRHADALDAAERTLRRIAQDDVSRRKLAEQVLSDSASIKSTASAAATAWFYHGHEAGVRVYSADELGGEDDRPKDGQQQREQIPCFRGEGALDGNWRLDDVLATIASCGARAVWDKRWASFSGTVVAHLSITDCLLHTQTENAFPVGRRDSVLASSSVCDSENLALHVQTSVDDELVPVGTTTRNHVALAGWILRKRTANCSSAPAESAIAEEDEDADFHSIEGTHDLAWKRHNKTRSRQFEPLSHTLPTLARMPATIPEMPPPIPNTQRPQLAHRTSQSSITGVGGNSALQRKTSLKPQALIKNGPAQSQIIAVNGIGESEALNNVRATFVVKALAGGTVPASFVNQLSTVIPLVIATVNKYLKQYGFAPHLVDREGISVLSEDYQARSNTYSIAFTVAPDRKRDIRLRFHGLSFGDDEAEVNVSAANWRLEHDFPDAPSTSQKQAATTRPRLLQRLSTPLVMQVKGQSDDIDAAALRGAQGGCTIVIPVPNKAIHPITIIICRKPKAVAKKVTSDRLAQSLARANAQIDLEFLDLDEQESSSLRAFAEGERELQQSSIVARAYKHAAAF